MCRVIIDTEKLMENVRVLQSKTQAEIIGVMKCNGYGLDTVQMAQILKQAGVRTFAVTETDDLPLLRQRVLTEDEDILLMRSSCLPEDAEQVLTCNATATVGSIESARVLNETAAKYGKKAYAHIKIDTGMGRYGFLPDETDQILEVIKMENLQITGFYTHFSDAFSPKDHVRAQADMFRRALAELKKRGVDTGKTHCSNSNAFVKYGSFDMEAVRLGSALLGKVHTDASIPLKDCVRVTARVLDTKNLKKGSTVGYSRSAQTKRDTKIAVVPAGHFQGFGMDMAVETFTCRKTVQVLLRDMMKFIKKKNLYVTIRAKQYPVIGYIGLSYAAVDITGSDVMPGDEAELPVPSIFVDSSVRRIYK